MILKKDHNFELSTQRTSVIIRTEFKINNGCIGIKISTNGYILDIIAKG